MSSFPDSFAQLDDDSVPSGEFDSYAPHHFSEPDSVAESPIFQDGSDHSGDGFFSQGQPDTPLSPPIYVGGGEDGSLDGPIFPPPTEMRPEGSFALREWRRQNAARLEEKEKREKELLNQIIDEADEYKIDFYRKRTLICENAKTTNREKEKLLVANLEKFHSEADKNYWKSITELIPSEVPNIEKRGKRDQGNKKPSINVVQGPKPGKPTELSRMRQILVKLKQSTPPHLKLSPAPLSTTVDAVVGRAAVTDATKRGAAATTLAPESIAVA